MKIKAASSRSPALSMMWIVLFAAGLIVPWSMTGSEALATSAVPELSGPFQRSSVAHASGLGLPKLEVEIAPQHAAVLQRARDSAMAAGVLESREDEVVPARVRLAGGEFLDARVRLKGDWLDHVNTDKWSFRIELRDGKQMGMSTYSIQNPKTRGLLMEWLIMAVARRDGLLAPRSTFVDVKINSYERGVYYLEEHFSKQLLESQGRREGAIVRFREDSMWSAWRQFRGKNHDHGPLPPLVDLATTGHVAELAGYDEKRLGGSELLNARLQRALALLRQAQRVALAKDPRVPLASLQAFEELEGRALDGLFVADKLGRAMALCVVFKAWHGTAWNQLRFYHDPVLDRLEPIMFDSGATPMSPEPIASLMEILLSINRADQCYEAGYRALREIADPNYLSAMIADFGAPLQAYADALAKDGLLPEAFDVATIFDSVAKNCAEVRNLIHPEDAANVSARLVESVRKDGSEAVRMIEVDVWSTTMVPVEVLGFAFSNGRRVLASAAVELEPGGRERHLRDEGAVALPRGGRRMRFHFPVDQRLSSLRDVQAIKRAVRAGLDKDAGVRLEVDIEFRLVGGVGERVRERLRIRRQGDGAAQGRPSAPTRLAALDRHECLSYDLVTGRMALRRGVWDVVGDLVVPAGVVLEASGGTTLRFEPGAVLLTESAVTWVGAAGEPVRIEARDPALGFGGVVVCGARQRSRLEHVVVLAAKSVQRGGWQTSGGVTFYRSAVDVVDSTFVGALGEDAVNVFGCDLAMRGVRFRGGASDLLDGDFVTAELRDCEFSGSVEDAIDVSGSQVVIENCVFDAVGDKALSIGEDSTARILNCRVERAAIALAAKDLSEVDVRGLVVGAVDEFLVAVYVKKPEFGSSSVVVRDLAAGSVGRARYLVQSGCSLEVDGEVIPGVDVDVADLYRRKILGK